jgi:hypothetical protein
MSAGSDDLLRGTMRAAVHERLSVSVADTDSLVAA